MYNLTIAVYTHAHTCFYGFYKDVKRHCKTNNDYDFIRMVLSISRTGSPNVCSDGLFFDTRLFRSRSI